MSNAGLSQGFPLPSEGEDTGEGDSYAPYAVHGKPHPDTSVGRMETMNLFGVPASVGSEAISVLPASRWQIDKPRSACLRQQDAGSKLHPRFMARITRRCGLSRAGSPRAVPTRR